MKAKGHQIESKFVVINKQKILLNVEVKKIVNHLLENCSS